MLERRQSLRILIGKCIAMRMESGLLLKGALDNMSYTGALIHELPEARNMLRDQYVQIGFVDLNSGHVSSWSPAHLLRTEPTGVAVAFCPARVAHYVYGSV